MSLYMHAPCFLLSLKALKQPSRQSCEAWIPCDSDPEVEFQRREVTYLKPHSWEEVKP